MDNSNIKTLQLGDVLRVIDSKNSQNDDFPFMGVNIDKQFVPTVANVSTVDKRNTTLFARGNLSIVECKQDGTSVFALAFIKTHNQHYFLLHTLFWNAHQKKFYPNTYLRISFRVNGIDWVGSGVMEA